MNYFRDFFFPRAGYIYSNSSYQSSLYVGDNGYAWSSTIDSTNYAYYLNFYDTNVYPSYSLGRYNGFPVRCLVN